MFALASLAGGTAADAGVLVGARALQGLGGAIMAAASLAIITSSFAAGPERHRAIGLWGAMNGAGGAAGTLLGGIITQELSWRWVLLINLPIGIAGALVASAVVVDRPRERSGASFDLGGALAITLGLLSLVYGIVNAGPYGWGSPRSFGPIALGLALLALFVLIEARLASQPLVPLRVFSNRLVRVSNIVVVAFSAALFPMWYFCSLYLQQVLHFGPLDAGLAFLPMALTIMACATQAGGLVMRFGAGPVLGAGLAVMASGLALFAVQISVDGDYVTSFLLPSLLTSVGIGFSVVPSTIAATASAPPQRGRSRVRPREHLASDGGRARARDPRLARGALHEPPRRCRLPRARARRDRRFQARVPARRGFHRDRCGDRAACDSPQRAAARASTRARARRGVRCAGARRSGVRALSARDPGTYRDRVAAGQARAGGRRRTGAGAAGTRGARAGRG